MSSTLFSSDPVSRNILARIGADTRRNNRRFVARNFALEENVSDGRGRSYEVAIGQIASDDMGVWQSKHWSYLSSQIYKGAGEGYDFGGNIDRADPECPASFQDTFALVDYAGSDEQLDMLRVETATGMAHVIASGSGDKLRVAQRLRDLAMSAGPGGLSNTRAAINFDRELRTWGRSIDRRPAFVTWAGLLDGLLFDDDPANDAPDWADEIRDRLGLCQVDVGETLIVFRYSVADLPRFVDDPTIQPLAVPTVIDFGFYDAFCPAPRNQAAGHTVDLAGHGRLQPEILHPGLRLQAKHLFRVGTVKRRVPLDLTAARMAHFAALRGGSGRPDYGVTTEV